MKKVLLALSIISVLFTTGCIKELINPDDDKSGSGNNQTNNQGEITFSNGSSNPYACYLDGRHVFDMDGGYYQDVSVSPGSHNVRAVQISGYLFYPTDISTTIYVSNGESVIFSFP